MKYQDSEECCGMLNSGIGFVLLLFFLFLLLVYDGYHSIDSTGIGHGRFIIIIIIIIIIVVSFVSSSFRNGTMNEELDFCKYVDWVGTILRRTIESYRRREDLPHLTLPSSLFIMIILDRKRGHLYIRGQIA